MPEQFSRSAMLFGEENMKRIFSGKVAIFGIGGVGGYCVEALARSGVGTLDLYDGDRVCVTNLNRQIIATWNTIGRYKAEVMRERILEINPNANVTAHNIFYTPENAHETDLSKYDYIVDAIDMVSAKIELICRAEAAGVPIISSMGAANKLDPTAFEVADIYETTVCPLARVMRRELRKRGVQALRVVYSKESPAVPLPSDETSDTRRQIPASNAFVPPVAGLIMAAEIISALKAQTILGNSD